MSEVTVGEYAFFLWWLPAGGEAELLRVLMLLDFDRAGRIGEFYGDPWTRTFAELLIDLQEFSHARAVVLGDLREREPRGEP